MSVNPGPRQLSEKRGPEGKEAATMNADSSAPTIYEELSIIAHVCHTNRVTVFSTQCGSPNSPWLRHRELITQKLHSCSNKH